jgi:hypothetical protein
MLFGKKVHFKGRRNALSSVSLFRSSNEIFLIYFINDECFEVDCAHLFLVISLLLMSLLSVPVMAKGDHKYSLLPSA